MLRWSAVLYAFFMTSAATSITNEEVEEDALVRFHWSESNKMRNNTKYGTDVRRRSAALDGQLATIMEPPFGPFWSKNPKRIVIQSLDDPNIILAVKQRNLKLEERIKIHLFHAQNDTFWSEEYLRKEREFCYAPGNDYVHSYEGLRPIVLDQLSMDSRTFVNNITLLPNTVKTANQWMTTIKKFIADILWERYQAFDSSSSCDDGMNAFDTLTRYNDDFRNTLKIHFKSIHQHGGIYQEMRWPPNNRILEGWLYQGMEFVAYTFHERIQLRLKLLEALPTSPTIHPLCTKMLQDVAQRDETEFNEVMSTVDERMMSFAEQRKIGVFSHTEFHERFVSLLLAIPQYVLSGVKRFQEIAIIRDIGETLVRVHPALSQGNTIAIAVPGDIIPNVDRLENFLYRAIKRLGLKRKCKVEVFEV